MSDELIQTDGESCTLDAETRNRRREELRDGLMRRVCEVRELANGYALRFAATAEDRLQVDDFVAFERRCCSFLDYALREESDELWLDLTGSPAAQRFVRELLSRTGVELPTPEGTRERRGLRGALAGAFGGAVAVLCCFTPAVPWALAALGLGGWASGAGEVLELAGLVLFAVCAWFLVRRLRARAAPRTRALHSA